MLLDHFYFISLSISVGVVVGRGKIFYLIRDIICFIRVSSWVYSLCNAHLSFCHYLTTIPFLPVGKNCRKVECMQRRNACQLPIRFKLIYSVSQVRAEFGDKMKLKISRKKLTDMSKRMNQPFPNDYICYLTMHKLTSFYHQIGQ